MTESQHLWLNVESEDGNIYSSLNHERRILELQSTWVRVSRPMYLNSHYIILTMSQIAPNGCNTSLSSRCQRKLWGFFSTMKSNMVIKPFSFWNYLTAAKFWTAKPKLERQRQSNQLNISWNLCSLLQPKVCCQLSLFLMKIMETKNRETTFDPSWRNGHLTCYHERNKVIQVNFLIFRV